MKPVAILLILLATFSAWAAGENTNRTALKRIDATYFTFDIPADMVKTKVQGMDSHVDEYQSPNVRLGFDFGRYSDPLDYDERLPGYAAVAIRVDGRRARIVTFRQNDGWFTAIHFRDAGSIATERMKLTMRASCSTDRELKVAKDIFTSIRFRP